MRRQPSPVVGGYLCHQVLLVAWLIAVATGCTDPAKIQPGDIRTYTAPASPKPIVKQSTATRDFGGPTLTFDPPSGWTDRGASGMRLATLVFETGSKQHEVTVMPMGGTIDANVSRWLGQLDPEATPESLVERTRDALAAAEKVSVGDAEATLVSLMEEDARDDDEVILGGIIPLDGSVSLFVTFKGPAAVARQAREPFRRFVSSIRWK